MMQVGPVQGSLARKTPNLGEERISWARNHIKSQEGSVGPVG